MYPRTPSSAPPLPIITLPSTTLGAPVTLYGFVVSKVSVVQIGLPLAASSAISRPSRAPTYTLPLYNATPLFTTSQQAIFIYLRDTTGSYFQINFPETASNANTTLHGPDTYIFPSTTKGVASIPLSVSRL